MKEPAQKLYAFALQFIKVFCLFLTGVLFLCAFLTTCYVKDMSSQSVLTRWDNPVFNLLGIAIFLCIAWIFCFKIKRITCQKKKTILLSVIWAWYLILGIILILFSKTVPAADSMSVYSAAEQLSIGNLNVIHPTDSYLSYYPQQIGLVAYYELIIRLWHLIPINLQAYHFIKCINLLWAGILIYAGYRAVQLMFQNDKTDIIYLLLMLCDLPLLLYTSFVYGEVPSFALFSIGLWALLSLLHKIQTNSSNGQRLPASSWVFPAIASILAFTASVMLRKNALILVIAVFLVTLFESLYHKKLLLLSLSVCCMISAGCILPAVTALYEYRAGRELLTGVPPLSYLAMGMQEAPRANGWYNAFNFNTYQSTGMDTAATNQISRTAIRERLTYFQKHPGYALKFYCNKFLSQWSDGTYASRQATLATFGGRIAFFQELYEGKYSKYFIGFCNALQNVLYLGSFLFCIFFLRSKSSHMSEFSVYLCLIGVIGGFLFHMLWEANSRYIFPYSLLLVPYASHGIGSLLTSWERRISGSKK